MVEVGPGPGAATDWLRHQPGKPGITDPLLNPGRFTLMVRLQTLGFERITVGADDRTHFVAHKPVPS